MQSAPYHTSSYERRAPLRRRVAALVLTLAAEVLILLALLSLSASPPFGTEKKGGPLVVHLLPNASDEPTKDANAAAPAASATHPVPPPPRVKPPPIAKDSDLGMLVITREQYAAADIGNLPHPEAGANSGSSTGQDSSSDGPGTGPHGERLYNAEWYREPTDAELRFYLPKRMPRTVTAFIACRTIERYHVDDCFTIGDSPPGSGLAYAMTNAAWQFLVVPPRIGGRTMVGEWVRIRFNFTEKVARTADE